MQSKALFSNLCAWVSKHTSVPPPERTLNDLLTDAQAIAYSIKITSNEVHILRCTDQVEGLAFEYRHLPESAYWVNRLCKQILLRRCELLATRYAGIE